MTGEGMEKKTSELNRKRTAVSISADEKRIQKQHGLGKMTALERIEHLLDDGSFKELDRFVQHRCTAPKMANACPRPKPLLSSKNLRASITMLQYRNNMVNDDDRADMVLIMRATRAVSPKAKSEKKRPSIWNRGAPGGWPTCSLKAVAIYSPQSQKLAVGSEVMM